MELKSRAEAVVAFVVQRGGELERLEVPPPVPPEVLARAVAAYPHIPAALLALYRQHDGLRLEWYRESGADVATGVLRLSPVGFLLGGRAEEWSDDAFEDILWSSDEDEDQRETLALRRRLKILDNNSGSQTFTLIDVREPGAPLYLYQGARLSRLSVDFAGYLDAALRLLAFSSWQRAFIGDDGARTQAVARMRHLVPEEDLRSLGLLG